MLLALSVVLVGLAVLVRIYFYHAYKYWKRKGVGFLEPKFPLGSSSSVLPTGLSIGIQSKYYYDALKKKGLKFGGLYLIIEPNLVLIDPDYVRDIMTRDFQHFVDRGIYSNEREDPIGFHLFSADGPKWRQLRVILTPTFTSGKMKMMFQTVIDCSDNMIQALEDHSGTDVEIREFLARFTTDVIGSVAFGIECNSFKDPDAEFRRMGKKIFKSDFLTSIKKFIAQNMPRLAHKLAISVNDKEVCNFFTKTVYDVIEYRRRSSMRRNDFLQILIDLNEGNDQKITLNEIVAQVFLFFIAGFDTSSTTMNFSLYELARNQNIQDKLRKEIDTVLLRYNGKITYESLNEMEYLDQIIKEAVRMYPPLPTLTRTCTKDYTLRDTNITIERGTPVIIPIYGLHMDPEYFPDPTKFDPDRFTTEMKSTRHPYVHLPFGEGPRNCIGLRFGYMQSKIGIVSVIKNFRVAVSPKTQPVVLDPLPFLLKSKNPVYLMIDKL